MCCAGWGWSRGCGPRPFYPRSWNNRDWKSGEVLFDMLFGQPAEEKYGAPYLLAHRGDLHAALAGAVPERPGPARSSADGHRAGGQRWRAACLRQRPDRRGRRRDRRRRREFVVKDALFGKDDPNSSTASPIAPSSRRACSTASTSATAPNGGARIATSSCTR